jgi:hypothetical protein
MAHKYHSLLEQSEDEHQMLELLRSAPSVDAVRMLECLRSGDNIQSVIDFALDLKLVRNSSQIAPGSSIYQAKRPRNCEIMSILSAFGSTSEGHVETVTRGC